MSYPDWKIAPVQFYTMELNFIISSKRTE